MKAPIALKPYDPHWPALFEIERQAMQRSGGWFKAMYHVGSTSIPGMAAKPIIDILVVLDRHEDGFAVSMRCEGSVTNIAARAALQDGTIFARAVHTPTTCICSRLAIPMPGVISDFATTFVPITTKQAPTRL